MNSIQHPKGNLSPSLGDTIRIDGDPFDLTGSTVRFKMRAEDSTTLKVNAAATVVVASTTLNGTHVFPTPTVLVASTAGFLDEGALAIGGHFITYTGRSATAFLGCRGGDGSVAGGVTVAQIGGVRYDWVTQDVDTGGEFKGWWEVTLPNTKTQDTLEFGVEMLEHVSAADDLDPGALVTLEEARRFVLRNDNDYSRDEILVEAINDVSAAIAEYCEREFVDTTEPDREGTDGVTDGSTTFVAATGAFTSEDVGALINIVTKGMYRIVSVTNGTTVVLDGSPSAGTSLTWQFGETRIFDVGVNGRLNLAPFDLRVIDGVTLYSDQTSDLQHSLDATEYRLRPTNATEGGTWIYMHTLNPVVSPLETQFGYQASVRGFWGMGEVPGGVKLACLQWVDNIVKNPGGFASNTMSGFTVVSDTDTLVVAPAGMPTAVRYRLERHRRGVWLR